MNRNTFDKTTTQTVYRNIISTWEFKAAYCKMKLKEFMIATKSVTIKLLFCLFSTLKQTLAGKAVSNGNNIHLTSDIQ